MHRINFRISKELLERFHNASLKAGIPKSYLLRDWVNEVNIDELYSVRTQNQGNGMTTYNFLVETEFKEKIEFKSQTMGIEASEFLRRLIEKNSLLTGLVKSTNKNLNKFDPGRLKNMWLTGDYFNYLDICEDNLNNLDVESISYYSNIISQFSDISKLYALSEYLENKVYNDKLNKLRYLNELNIINHKILYLSENLNILKYELENIITELTSLSSLYKEVLGYARYLYG
jgi:predicted DNA-binding protein